MSPSGECEERFYQQLYGVNNRGIDLSTGLDRGVVAAFQRLQNRAKQAGFDLVIASAHRGFERQLTIWNAKAAGQRPVLDDDDNPIDINNLNDWEQVQAILRWSALPGASRHHWGTDMDIYDKAAVADDYTVELTAAEVAVDVPFGPMHQWLDQQIANGSAEGFFRPYDIDRGGVAPERWHLSYFPLAEKFQQNMTLAGLEAFLHDKPLLLKDAVLAHLPELYGRYIDLPS